MKDSDVLVAIALGVVIIAKTMEDLEFEEWQRERREEKWLRVVTGWKNYAKRKSGLRLITGGCG